MCITEPNVIGNGYNIKILTKILVKQIQCWP